MNVSKHPLYGTWHGIFTRCYNKNSKDYKYYGGKGITVCRRWSIKGGDGFRNFVADMGTRPPGHTLDRIDRTKPYSPENCRWASALEQINNRSVATSVSYNGETHTITEWSKKTGIGRDVLYRRLRYEGWSIKKALTEPVTTHPAKRGKKFFTEYHGKTVDMAYLEKLTGLERGTIRKKLKMGYTIDEIVKNPRAKWGTLKRKNQA